MITPEMVAQAVRDYIEGRPFEVDSIPHRLKPPLSTEPLQVIRPHVRRVVDTRVKMRKRQTIKYTHRTPAGVKVKDEKLKTLRTIRPPQRQRVQAPPPKKPIVQPARRRVHPGPKKRERWVQNKPAERPQHSPVPRSPVVAAPSTSRPPKPVQGILEAYPSVKAPLTLCVLLYGDYLDIVKRCLKSVRQYLPPGFADLRIGMNAVSPRVREWVQRYVDGTGARVYDSEENIFKYPMMRQMFNDPPITTEWIMWLDDDSHLTASDFAPRLEQFLAGKPCDYLGKPYIYTWLKPGQVKWIEEASWYNGKAPLVRRGRQGKEKRLTVEFATGGFWCIRSAVVRALDWPDPRIGHNFGDVSLGEAIRQNDYRFGKFHHGVAISDAKRRGASQRHPGS
jgi:hypothetical protein